MRLSDSDIFRIPVGPGMLHVERYGYGGTPIVLLHGFGTTAFLWRRIAPALAVQGHTAFAIDLFGYGASDRPDDGDFGIRAQSLYIRRALSDLEIVKPTMVGCDLGAVVALRVAFDLPECVDRLVLVSPGSIRDLPGPHIRLMRRATARHVVRVVGPLFGAEPLIRVLLQSSVLEPLSLSPRLIGRYVAPYVGRDGVNHLLALARALENDDVSRISPRSISHPVLIVRGMADQWCSEDYIASLLLEFPNARVELIPDVGRLVAEENPEALTDVIRAHTFVEASTA